MFGKKNFKVEFSRVGSTVVLQGSWDDSIGEYIRKKKIKGLSLNHTEGWDQGDLEFLRELPNLESIQVIGHDIKGYLPLQHLRKLKEVMLDNYYTDNKIDFDWFPNVERVEIDWGKKIKNFSNAVHTKYLSIYRFKSVDLSELSSFSELEELVLKVCPAKSIKGISNLKKIKILYLMRFTKLESLEGLEGLENVEDFVLDTCKKVINIDQISGLKNVKTMRLDNLGEIESLKPLQGLDNLEELYFAESTNIKDGDLSVLLTLPRLKKVLFVDRKHYSHSNDELEKLLK